MDEKTKQLIKETDSLIYLLRSYNWRDIFRTIWEVRSLQKSSGFKRSNLLNITTLDIGSDLLDNRYLKPWMLDQILNISSIYSHCEPTKKRFVSGLRWGNFLNLYNAVSSYNNIFAGVELEKLDVLAKMSALGAQQFLWQDGSLGFKSFERTAYIYSNDICDKYCYKNSGLTVTEFLNYGFISLAQFFASPIIQFPYKLDTVNGSEANLKKFLNRLSIPYTQLRNFARRNRRDNFLYEYDKSIFFEKPIIKIHHDRFFCPLPELIVFRVSNGIISETSGHVGEVRSVVGKNFENYTLELFQDLFPAFKVHSEETYGSRKAIKNTPDIRISDDNGLNIIIECKTTRMSHEDQFGVSYPGEMIGRIGDLIKGVTQIWKYVDDVNQGTAPDTSLSDEPKGVVITLDTWIRIDFDRHNQIVSEANKLADEKGISQKARIDVLVIPSSDFEYVYQVASPEQFIETLHAAHAGEFNGYMFSNVFRQKFGSPPIQRPLSISKDLKKKWLWKDT